MALGKPPTTTLARTGQPSQVVGPIKLPTDVLERADRDIDDLSEGKTPTLPRDMAFSFIGTLLEVRFEDYYDSRGLKLTFRCEESNVQEMRPGKEYCVIYYYNHPTIPPLILERHELYRTQWFKLLGDKLGIEGKGAKVLQQLNARVEPIDVRIRYDVISRGLTRNGKQKLDHEFELVAS